MAGLPDLITDQIFRRLITTKPAVRMSFMSKQWENILSSLPMLDFNEDDINIDDNKHKNFINILRRYVKIYMKNRGAKRATPLVKLRLNMTRYASRDARVVSKFLSSSMVRSVKELDISLRGVTTMKNYYHLRQMHLMNAKNLTTLNLEYVRMKKIYHFNNPNISDSPCFLPCLKTMSLKNVEFSHINDLLLLVFECPSIEHLSLDSCGIESSPDLEFYLESDTLKSLEIRNCVFTQAEFIIGSLESLTLVSSELRRLDLRAGSELRHVYISAQCLEGIKIDEECRDVVDFIIDAPTLRTIKYIGYLGFKFSLNSVCLREAVIEPLLVSNEELPSIGPWRHFPELKDFLVQFVNCRSIILYAKDVGDLIFPQEFRKMLTSPILPNLKFLQFGFLNAPISPADDKDLRDAMFWMAPNVLLPGSYVLYWKNHRVLLYN